MADRNTCTRKHGNIAHLLWITSIKSLRVMSVDGNLGIAPNIADSQAETLRVRAYCFSDLDFVGEVIVKELRKREMLLSFSM